VVLENAVHRQPQAKSALGGEVHVFDAGDALGYDVHRFAL
jgi:hypothetical protein